MAENFRSQGNRNLPLVVLAAAQLVALLPIGLLDPMKYTDVGWFQRSHAIAIVLGCGFAQASVAAAWMALGPLPFRVRAPASAAWTFAAALLLVVNVAIHSQIGEGVLLGASFLGVWWLVQLPIWIARGLYRLRLESRADGDHSTPVGEHQFGIRQLLIATAAVAITLGFGRLLVLKLNPDEVRSNMGGPLAEMLAIVALFVICNSLVAFTVITGALLPRNWIFAAALGCCAAAAITLVEWSLFASVFSGPDKWESLVILGGMNGIQFSWLLGNLITLRQLGYRLMASPAA